MAILSANNTEFSNISTILLDKDGTFLDDHIYWGKLAELRINKIIQYFKIDKNMLEQLCFTIGYDNCNCKLIKGGAIGVMSRNDVIDFMVSELERYNINTDFGTLSNLFDVVHCEFLNNVEKYVKFINYSENFIINLKKHGLKLAVVTSDTHSHTEKILKILNIQDCFDCIIGKDDCENDKKSGEPAIVALNNLAAKKEGTLVIGDAQMDFLMAQNSGIKNTILVATGQTEENELRKYTNCVVKNLSEVFIK